MNKTMCGIVLTGLVLCGAGDSRPFSDQLQELRDQIAALEARVVDLEKAAPDAPQAVDGPVLQLLEIEPMPADDAKLSEAMGLEAEANDLEAEAAEADRERAQITDSKIHDPPEGYPPQKSTEARKDHLRKLAFDLRDRAKDKRAQASKLRRDATTKRQRIYGWNGERQIILETRRDLSVALTRIAPRGFISWTGRRIGLSGATERFEVTSIDAAHRPKDFIDSP